MLRRRTRHCRHGGMGVPRRGSLRPGRHMHTHTNAGSGIHHRPQGEWRRATAASTFGRHRRRCLRVSGATLLLSPRHGRLHGARVAGGEGWRRRRQERRFWRWQPRRRVHRLLPVVWIPHLFLQRQPRLVRICSSMRVGMVEIRILLGRVATSRRSSVSRRGRLAPTFPVSSPNTSSPSPRR